MGVSTVPKAFSNRRLGKAGVVALLLFPGAAFADYQDGLDAYTFGDYGRAMAEWQAVVATAPAEVNPAIYAEAHYAIAKLYWEGSGVEQDYRQAHEWLLRAAELGHAGAQAKLGFMYTDGLAVRQDFGRAFDWYSKAARGGNVDGLYNLGIFYSYGWGVAADRVMAAQYLAAASALGDAQAEEALQQVLAQIAQEQADAAAVVAEETPEMVTEPGALPEPPEPAEIPAPLIRDAGWIAQQDPDRYTIQVMAISDRALIERLVEPFAEWAPFAIYTVQKNTNPLHVLVQGSYPDVESAREAQSRFPRKIQRRDKLWIRRFEMVQKLLE